jgi:hypothetical protein
MNRLLPRPLSNPPDFLVAEPFLRDFFHQGESKAFWQPGCWRRWQAFSAVALVVLVLVGAVIIWNLVSIAQVVPGLLST